MKPVKYIIAIIFAVPILWVAGLAFLPYTVSIYLHEFDAKKRQAYIRNMDNIDMCYQTANGSEARNIKCLDDHGLGNLVTTREREAAYASRN